MHRHVALFLLMATLQVILASEVKDWSDNFVLEHHRVRQLHGYHGYFHRLRNHMLRKHDVKDSSKNENHQQDMGKSNRQNHPLLDPDLLSKAKDHLKEIRDEYSCLRPRPTLVYIQEHFQEYNPPKKYFPSCTLLHRCDRESGCCSSEGHECGPKKQQAVEKYFIAIRPNNRTLVEMISFENHTECECRAINRHPRTTRITYRPAPSVSRQQVTCFRNILENLVPAEQRETISNSSVDEESTSSSSVSPKIAASTTSLPSTLLESSKNNFVDGTSSENINSVLSSLVPVIAAPSSKGDGQESVAVNSNPEPLKGDNSILSLVEEEEAKEKISICGDVRCPKPFVLKLMSSFPIICYCDCQNDLSCDRIRRGLHRLDLESTRCITKGRCLPPRCAYGCDFDLVKRFCPKKETQEQSCIRPHFRHSGKIERD